jgi:2-dehydropantoate 2-reductase
MRAAIYGAGAMGTILGAYITKAGKEIDLITRNAEHVKALKEKGAHIVGSVDFTVRVNALLPEEMTGKYDVIFLMTKQRGNAQTVTFLKDYLADGGVICTTQNGLPEQSVAEVVGEENTVGCAISWGATFNGSGEAALTSSPDKLTFALGTPFGENQKVYDVKPYLDCMGKVTVESDFLGARFSKLIINSAFSSLSAISGLTFGEVAGDRRIRHYCQCLLKEGMDAAKGNGIKPAKIQGHDLVKLLGYKTKFKKAVSFALIPLAMAKHKNLVSGMCFDLQKGRECDIDYICGVISCYGKKANVATPFTDKVISIAHSIERGERQVCRDNLSELENLLK